MTLDFLPFLKGDYQKRVHSDVSSLTTSWSTLASDTIPGGYIGIVTGLAADNTVDATIDLYINEKTASEYGFPVMTKSLPANMDSIEPMAIIPSGQNYKIRGRGVSGAVTLAWRVEVLLVKQELLR